MSKPRTIHLYPVPGVSAYPWPAQEFDATPDQWAELRGYIPPPFTDRPPGDAPETAPTDPPDNGGSSDSTEA